MFTKRGKIYCEVSSLNDEITLVSVLIASHSYLGVR